VYFGNRTTHLRAIQYIGIAVNRFSAQIAVLKKCCT